MQTKSLRGHVETKDATSGIAEVVVSAYGNLDYDGDIVLPGATSKQVERLAAGQYGPNPKGMLDHNLSMAAAVAKTQRMWEEDDGLHIEAQYNLDKQAGRDAFSDLQFYGDDMEFSVSYDVTRAVAPTKKQQEAGVKRLIAEWEVAEWSHVWLGANSQTHLVGVKSFTPDELKTITQEAELEAGFLSIDDIRELEQDPAETEPAVEREPAVDAPGIDPLSVAKFRHLVASTRT